MRLTEKPPVTVTIFGKEYEIQSDYREVLLYEETISKESSELEIVQAIDRMYCQNDEIVTAEKLEEAVKQLNWFISCGDTGLKKRPSRSVLGINCNKPFDFQKDGELIYSAFIQSYGMDIFDMPYLHWWKFNFLLADVEKDTRFAKVMEYRTIDTKNKNLSKEQKKLYSALQNYYKITEERSSEEEAFIQALLEGRDPMK